MFLIKKKKKDNASCKIHYVSLDDFWKKEQKLEWLAQNPMKQIPFEIIRPDKNNNWINLADSDFENLIPVRGSKGLFKINSLGVSTNRDEWVYDFSKITLERKIKYFIDKYNSFLIAKNKNFETTIKWSSTLKTYFTNCKRLQFDKNKIIFSSFRPFTKAYFYSEKILNDRLTANHSAFFGNDYNRNNIVICFNGNGKDFRYLATNRLFDLHFTGDTNSLPLYSYDANGNKLDNITDWGFNQFTKRYGKRGMSKEAIFHYVYAVLHNPAYRKKYELDLKREFPRIPFYDDFKKWAEWGSKLMDLHINYETVLPYNLKELTTDKKENPNAKLKADKEAGTVILDENTVLAGIPKAAWSYKLGNRSALEWILDQYKESKPKDHTIAEKFSMYKFSDYKEHVIDLLKRVCTVSVETMKIIEQMQQSKN